MLCCLLDAPPCCAESLVRQEITDWGTVADSSAPSALTFVPGWFDALDRGVANDYCRMVGAHRRPFLSCALAGSRQQYSAPGRFRPDGAGGVERNPCFQVSCGLNGRCREDNGLCECLHGFSGAQCEVPSDVCAEVDCGAKGRCVGGACRCNRGWTGDRCQTNKCASSKINCGEHGVCFDGKCHCTKAFSGDHCQYKARQAVTDLGLGGEAAGWFDVQGQSGTTDVSKQHVKNDYCRWVGHEPAYYSCALAGSRDQYTPPGLVEFDLTARAPRFNKCFKVDCGDNGRCDGSTGKCLCKKEWSGERCQLTAAADVCDGVQCGANGVCSGGRCLCRENWSGSRCEVDPCSTLRCGAHGTCVSGRCECSARFEGPACQFRRRQPLIADKGRNGVWVDAQRQGKANDFCRVIPVPGGTPFVSCALAGAASPYTPPGAFKLSKGSRGQAVQVSFVESSGFDIAAAVAEPTVSDAALSADEVSLLAVSAGAGYPTMVPPGVYPSSCSGHEPLTQSGKIGLTVVCSPNAGNKMYELSRTNFPEQMHTFTKTQPTPTTLPTRYGECRANEGVQTCVCHGQPFGPTTKYVRKMNKTERTKNNAIA